METKFSDYLVWTGLNQAPGQVQVATRDFLLCDTNNKLRISVGVKDHTDMNVDQILESLRKFIRSKNEISLWTESNLNKGNSWKGGISSLFWLPFDK